jgi:S-formylglutathione hydrolase FrmB
VLAVLMLPVVPAATQAKAKAKLPPQNGTPKYVGRDGLQVTSVKQLDGRLVALTFKTAALPQPVSVRILLPAGYATSRKRFPVLYLLDGTSGTAADWTTSGSAEATSAGKPLIVVMPDITLNGDGGGWCTDWPNGVERWETFHIGELVPYIDATLKTVSSRGGRAIAGLSQGGFCSTSYASRHPDLFGMVLSYSGAPDIAYDPDAHAGTMAVINATETGLDQVAPDTFFGSPVTDEINWAAHDPATLADKNLRDTRISLLTGNGLPGPLDTASTANPASEGIEGAVSFDTGKFEQRLTALGIPNTYNAYGPGTHSWPYWTRDFQWTIGAIMTNFAHPLGVPKQISYTSADATYSQYGWTVATHRAAREFSTLTGASCAGFTLSGSGSATVSTPACLKRGQRFTAAIRFSGHTTMVRGTADRAGRVRVPVSLGPSNPDQQDTAQSAISGTAVRSSTVTLKGIAPARPKRRPAKR